jgi:hypothetical protein
MLILYVHLTQVLKDEDKRETYDQVSNVFLSERTVTQTDHFSSVINHETKLFLFFFAFILTFTPHGGIKSMDS